MSVSASALWLDSFFAGYDHFFLKLLHDIATKLAVVLTPLMRFITFLGEKGILFFLLALIFLLMADRRDLGLCIFGAVCCGALITNIILKDSVARPRPFMSSAEYEAWWGFVGAPLEDGFSFPSGHVTACAAGMTAICLMRGKRWIVPSVVIVLLMGISRNYLMAHYPSDVLFAALIGVFSGFAAWFITQFTFNFLRRRRRSVPVFGLILDFDVRDYLPFTLPALPALPLKRGGAGRGERAARGAQTSAPAETPDAEDADMKTYRGSASRRAVRAEEEAPTPVRRAVRTEEETDAPVRRASAQTSTRGAAGGGRHALAPGASDRRGAALSSALKGLGASSGKKGRHELDRPRRLGASGTKKGRHEL